MHRQRKEGYYRGVISSIAATYVISAVISEISYLLAWMFTSQWFSWCCLTWLKWSHSRESTRVTYLFQIFEAHQPKHPLWSLLPPFLSGQSLHLSQGQEEKSPEVSWGIPGHGKSSEIQALQSSFSPGQERGKLSNCCLTVSTSSSNRLLDLISHLLNSISRFPATLYPCLLLGYEYSLLNRSRHM